MVVETATATEIQNNFGRYLSLVMSGQEFIVTKNGKEVAHFVPKAATVSYLTDSLTGILKGAENLDEARAERLRFRFDICQSGVCHAQRAGTCEEKRGSAEAVADL